LPILRWEESELERCDRGDRKSPLRRLAIVLAILTPCALISGVATRALWSLWSTSAEYRAAAQDNTKRAQSHRTGTPLYEREVERIRSGGRYPEKFTSRAQALAYYQSYVDRMKYMAAYHERRAREFRRAAPRPWVTVRPEQPTPPPLEGVPQD
jgi:hypothetical protein